MLASWRDTLAGAFYDDPVGRWMFPDDETRLEQSAKVWEIVLRPARRQRRLHVLPGATAVAVWEHQPPGPADELFARALGPRYDEIRDGLAMLAQASPETPHSYLEALGVRPDRQGQGLGAVLIGPRLRALDAIGKPTHLLSSNHRNLTFYRRMGFGEIDEVQLPDGPALTSMWREPGAGV